MFNATANCVRERVRCRQFTENSDSFSAFCESSLVHTLQVIVPNVTRLPEVLSDALSPESNAYLYIENMKLTALLDVTFIEAFVKKGSLSAFSKQGFLEEFVAIFPPGKLVVCLDVCKDLGLTKESNSAKKKWLVEPSNKITIDLLSEDFDPEKKLYKKVLSEFQKLCEFDFHILISWVPDDNRISAASSLHEYFTRQGYTCSICKPKQFSSVRYSVPVPKVDLENLSSQEDLLEWLGVQVCGIESSNESSQLVDEGYVVEEPSEIASQLFVGTWQGFYSSQCIQKLLSSVRSILSGTKSIPFAAAVVHVHQGHRIMCFPVLRESSEYTVWFRP